MDNYHGNYPPAVRPWARGLYLAVLLMASPALAHDWYDPACCSDRDCAPVPKGTIISQAKGGFSVKFPGTDDPVFFSDSAVKQSRDWDYHACISPNTGTPFCLYVPAGA